jgi:hypothetical protein
MDKSLVLERVSRKAENRRFTGFLKFGDSGVEEIDVDAPTRDAAQRMVLDEAKSLYGTGYRLVEVQERVGLYF